MERERDQRRIREGDRGRYWGGSHSRHYSASCHGPPRSYSPRTFASSSPQLLATSCPYYSSHNRRSLSQSPALVLSEDRHQFLTRREVGSPPIPSEVGLVAHPSPKIPASLLPPGDDAIRRSVDSVLPKQPPGRRATIGPTPRERTPLLGLKGALSLSPKMHAKTISSLPEFPQTSPPVVIDDSWKKRVPPEIVEGIPKLLKRRKQIANEMLSTETIYLSSLTAMTENFINPLKSDLRGLAKEDIFNLFANAEVIRTCHVSLNQSISACVSNWQDSSVLGNVFLNNMTFIKLYKYYVSNYPTACKTLDHCKEKCPVFRKYLESLEYSPALGNLSLDSLLITPVQRVPRYVLLLTDMLKYTPKEHPDYKPLQEALLFMQDLTDYINQHNQSELHEIEGKLANFNGDLTSNPKRRLIKEGLLSVNKSKSRLWLFSDIILITKPEPSRHNKYKFCRQVSLAAASVQTTSLPASSAPEFKLLSTEGTLRCVARTLEECQCWIAEINKVLEEMQSNLMQSLFNNAASDDNVEGSKGYWEAVEADNEKKRASIVIQLLETEKQYVSDLRSTFEIFILPLHESLKRDTCPLLQEQGVRNVCGNLELMITEHEQFLLEIEQRQQEWDQQESPTITDLFENRLPEISSLYFDYVVHRSEQVRALEAAHIGNPMYSKWLQETEESSHKSIKDQLTNPSKRVSEYYLLCHEMLQNTTKKHPDHDALRNLVTSIKTLTEDLNRSSVKGTPAPTHSPRVTLHTTTNSTTTTTTPRSTLNTTPPSSHNTLSL
ncbi:rho guanine nucleotide exchange factor [Pelomyxa schiedti]|nr:rho guanine nucleotide exchange factor [Pelomyxa schiedti]